MKANMTQKILAGVAVCALSSSSLFATIAYNFPEELAGNQRTGPQAWGSVFTTTAAIEVNALGAFDSGADGIGGSGVSVAIYSVSVPGNILTQGQLVVSPYTFSGTSDQLLSGSNTRIHEIDPVYLAPGTYMVVANHYGTGAGASEQNYNYYFDSTKEVLPTSNNQDYITFGKGFYLAADASEWTQDIPAGFVYDASSYLPRYAAGNFDFTPVPEASSFAVAGVGLLGLVYVGRCVVQRRKTVA